MLDWLEAFLPSTVSVIELAWSLPAVVGLVRYLERYWRARQKRVDNERKRINGELRIMARMRCIRFLALAVAFECFLGAGLVAMTLPQGPASDADSGAAWVIAACLFGVQMALLVSGEVLDFYERALAHLVENRLRATAQRQAAP